MHVQLVIAGLNGEMDWKNRNWDYKLKNYVGEQRTPPQKTRRSLSWKNPTPKAEIVAANMRIIVDTERRAQA